MRKFILKVTLLLSVSMMLAACGAEACPHCHIIAKATVVLSDGEKLDGYLLYYFVLPHADEETLTPGSDLKKYFVEKDVASIELAGAYHTFDNIGTVAALEEIRKLPLKDVKSIVFKSWEKNVNGGNVTISGRIPSADMQKMLNGKILSFRRIENAVFFANFVNFNPDVNEKDFNLLIDLGYRGNWSAEGVDNFFYFQEESDNTYGRSLTKEVFTEQIDKDIKFLSGEIEKIDSCESELVCDYLKPIRSSFERRIRFWNSLKTFILKSDTGPMQAFIDQEIQNEDTKANTTYILTDCTVKSCDWRRKTLRLFKNVAPTLVYNGYNTLTFYKFLSEHNIVSITIGFD